jgi:hypothetical protein
MFDLFELLVSPEEARLRLTEAKAHFESVESAESGEAEAAWNRLQFYYARLQLSERFYAELFTPDIPQGTQATVAAARIQATRQLENFERSIAELRQILLNYPDSYFEILLRESKRRVKIRRTYSETTVVDAPLEEVTRFATIYGTVQEIHEDYFVVAYDDEEEIEERELEWDEFDGEPGSLKVGDTIVAESRIRLHNPEAGRTPEQMAALFADIRRRAQEQAQAERKEKPLRRMSIEGQRVSDD